jgi:hypothetical protein
MMLYYITYILECRRYSLVLNVLYIYLSLGTYYYGWSLNLQHMHQSLSFTCLNIWFESQPLFAIGNRLVVKQRL